MTPKESEAGMTGTDDRIPVTFRVEMLARTLMRQQDFSDESWAWQ